MRVSKMPNRFVRRIWGPRRSGKTAIADQSGQAMVEFTFTFVLLCVLFIALLLLGWLFYSYVTISNAAREGSRHLLAHPVLPSDPSTFDSADAEATWVITNSVPMLNWRQMTVTITPPTEQRVYGGYILVRIDYEVSMPRIEIPLGFTGTTIKLVGPFQLRALSRRSLD